LRQLEIVLASKGDSLLLKMTGGTYLIIPKPSTTPLRACAEAIPLMLGTLLI
jgi:hypothetical protein